VTEVNLKLHHLVVHDVITAKARSLFLKSKGLTISKLNQRPIPVKPNLVDLLLEANSEVWLWVLFLQINFYIWQATWR
jgi:hypothetical protein